MNNYILSQIWLNTTYYVDQINEENGFRKDICGARICWNHYWMRDSNYWWEVDHIKPISRGWTDHMSNLRVLHRGNNASKSDGILRTSVKAQWIKNWKI